eukprot:gene2305-1442_t
MCVVAQHACKPWRSAAAIVAKKERRKNNNPLALKSGGRFVPVVMAGENEITQRRMRQRERERDGYVTGSKPFTRSARGSDRRVI